MYAPAFQAQLNAAEKKMKSFQHKPRAYASASMLAGFFIGLGLIFSQYIKFIFAASDPATGTVLTGISFSVGLMLVFFAGAELFTGNNLSMGAALMAKKIPGKAAVSLLAFCWLFNLLGSFVLGALFRLSGIGGEGLAASMLAGTAAKGALPIGEMIVRGIFCNIFVCLAVWSVPLMPDAAGKAIITIFCIGAFVMMGMEHCVANMSLFSYAILFSGAKQTALIGQSISPLLLLKNLFFVTLGNLLGGIIFTALPYFIAQEKEA